MRVLIVEDSDTVRRTAAKALRKAGYVVDESADGDDGLWRAREFEYDAIVLDRMLPLRDGMEVLAALRRSASETPVLLLTALNEVEDRVEGLRGGADDYLGKPFALEELVARVDVMLRKRFNTHATKTVVGDLEVDSDARRASRGGTPLELTAREFRLLQVLALERGKILSRARLERHLYDEDSAPMSNVVDATVYQLRRKLAAVGAGTPLIHTRRGLGYVLEVEA